MNRYRAWGCFGAAGLGAWGLAIAIVAGAGADQAGPAQEKKEEKKEEKKWDVADPIGPATKLEFETSEGTWINVDVSPDGRRIVFDLLGDLYVIPIDGGSQPATRLTSGPAYDMQPRFSPDGKRIAFSSDRGGLWNIWTTDTAGKDPKQISKDTRWFVNSPAWSPDGQYIFARRHFVRERSLGAGEIWMFHASGSDGLQVTEKVSFQKDAGEPAVSPDGRYLYFSKAVTPGQNFEYNKDPYGVIYAIVRRDLTTGKERTLVNRPGGSIAPRPSPDGKHLAFVRRVDTKSVLFLRELATGREWPIFDRLDKDLQEAWAIHGVYAQYAWAPDSRAIVIWGEGKIWKVRLRPTRGAGGERGEAAPPSERQASALNDRERAGGWGPASMENDGFDPIPFVARVEQRLNDAVRFPQKIDSDQFPVRMLRDAVTSPDGKLVAYSALGRIYVKSMPAGVPRPLTGGEGSRTWLESDPSFSPDGQSIVFAAWNDRDHGRIRVVRTDGSGVRDVVSQPGHYVEPSFSPDGKQIVYRRTTPDGIRGITHAGDPGIYVVGADGTGQPSLVRDSGSRPRFDHTGRRIYFRERRAEKMVLASLELDGSDEIVHFQSENATQIEPSPDGRFVAFAERWHAYVAAFPRSGRAIDLGPRGTTFPVARISRDAGMSIHWSGDGRKVHWTLGPEYFTRDMSRTFTFLAEADAAAEKPAEPEAKGVPIGFTVKSDRPTGSIALVGARIITMAGIGGRGSGAGDHASGARGRGSEAGGRGSEAGRGAGLQAREEVIENGTVLVEGNRIVAVGPSGSVTVPAAAKRIDAGGKTIMPGIIDVHAHVGGENDGLLAETTWPFVANLAYGVTTSHDPSNDTETVFTNSELIRAGKKLGPRLFSTGTILYGAETPFKAVVDTYEDALSHLRRIKAVGGFSVKSYNQQRRDARQMIIKAARELQMLVVPEGGSLLYMNNTHVLDGHTGVEHSLPVPVIYKDVVTLFAKSKSGYTPTLIVGYGGLSGEYYWYQHSDVWKNKRLLTFVPADVVVPRSRRRMMADEDDFNHILIAKGAKQIADAGGSVQVGAHGQLQGLGAHWETWMLAQGGLSPIEALRAATIKGAAYLGMEAEVGSLEKGKLADLVVLDRNPLENIRNTDSVNMVMLNGRLYDAATMDEIGNHPKKRKPFYWEKERTDTPTTTSAIEGRK
jgi:imidazolonepropionase-like amidohydrolase/Tol biopolymer transport system component